MTSRTSPPAAWARLCARGRAALVTSISSQVVTTGTPATISTGNPASGTRVILSGDLAPDHEQGDIVASRLTADESSHHRGAGCPRELRRYRPAKPGQAVVDQLSVIKTQHGAGRARHGSHRAL